MNINYQEEFKYQNVYYMNEFGGLAFEKGWFTLNGIVLLYMSSYNNQRDQKNSDKGANFLRNHHNSTDDIDDFHLSTAWLASYEQTL